MIVVMYSKKKNPSLKKYLNKNIDIEIEAKRTITSSSLDRTDGNLKDIHSNKEEKEKEKDLTGKDRNSHVPSRTHLFEKKKKKKQIFAH